MTLTACFVALIIFLEGQNVGAQWLDGTQQADADPYRQEVQQEAAEGEHSSKGTETESSNYWDQPRAFFNDHPAADLAAFAGSSSPNLNGASLSEALYDYTQAGAVVAQQVSMDAKTAESEDSSHNYGQQHQQLRGHVKAAADRQLLYHSYTDASTDSSSTEEYSTAELHTWIESPTGDTSVRLQMTSGDGDDGNRPLQSHVCSGNDGSCPSPYGDTASGHSTTQFASEGVEVPGDIYGTQATSFSSDSRTLHGAWQPSTALDTGINQLLQDSGVATEEPEWYTTGEQFIGKDNAGTSDVDASATYRLAVQAFQAAAAAELDNRHRASYEEVAQVLLQEGQLDNIDYAAQAYTGAPAAQASHKEPMSEHLNQASGLTGTDADAAALSGAIEEYHAQAVRTGASASAAVAAPLLKESYEEPSTPTAEAEAGLEHTAKATASWVGLDASAADSPEGPGVAVASSHGDIEDFSSPRGASGEGAAVPTSTGSVHGAGEAAPGGENQVKTEEGGDDMAAGSVASIPPPLVAAVEHEYVPDPLGGMSVADIQRKLKAAQALLFADPTGRNMTAGLQHLWELHKLVEAALPSEPLVRARYIPSIPGNTAGASGTSDDGGRIVGGSSGGGGEMAATPSAPKQRPLSVEVAASRLTGLSAAASATFQLAALQASGVMAPEFLPHDPMQAALALHQAARAGSLEALMALADRHAQGINTPASCARGLQFAKLAALYLTAEVEKEQRYAPPLAPVALRERHADGGYVAAEDAENGADVIHLEEDMALRGNADAMRRMAYRRLVGRGMEADPEGAFHDFQAAAAQGDPYAIFNIGYMYLRGLHVPQNYTAAKEQFEQAAAKGLPSAHNGLGVLAWNGHGMPQNLTAARESFERGAALNNSDSLYNLATMHYHGAGTPINQTIAVEYFKRAHEVGHWRAPYMLALAYEAGAGTEANCTRALQYLRSFFADRSTWGEQLTAAVKLLDAGDTRGALLTYVTVAEQGSAAAAANAAWMLRRRAGFKGRDADKLAAKYFQRAAKQGHTGSMIELAHVILAAAPTSKAPAATPAGSGPTTLAEQHPDAATDGAGGKASFNAGSRDTGFTDAGESGLPTETPMKKARNSGEGSEAADASADGRSDTVSTSLLQEALSNATSPVNAKPPASKKPESSPLVPPSPLPSGRAILGVSTAEVAVAWYRASASMGDPEGLFYLGWAHYHGVGVPENTTLARLLWLRSFEMAGVRSNRALAPLLALAGMRLDSWLAPVLGRHALARIHGEVMRVHALALAWVRSHGWATVESVNALPGYRDAVGGVRTGASGVTKVVRGALEDWWPWLERLVQGPQAENVAMVGLVAALVVVVVVRRRRMVGRTV